MPLDHSICYNEIACVNGQGRVCNYSYLYELLSSHQRIYDFTKDYDILGIFNF